MRDILSYPETGPHDVGLFEFLVDGVGLENILDLLTYFLEVFLIP